MKINEKTRFSKPLADSELADYAKWAQWCNENGCIIKDDNAEFYYCEAIPAPTLAEILTGYEANIGQRLDSFAVSAGYDNLLALCSYTASDNGIWAAQAKQMSICRDATWLKWYEIKDVAEEAGEVGSWEEVSAQLPQNPFAEVEAQMQATSAPAPKSKKSKTAVKS